VLVFGGFPVAATSFWTIFLLSVTAEFAFVTVVLGRSVLWGGSGDFVSCTVLLYHVLGGFMLLSVCWPVARKNWFDL